MDGFILQVFEKDRKHVVRGTPILEVGSPESVEIIAAYLSEEVLNIKKGQKALITNWGGDKPLSATVSEIEPQAREEISALGVKEKRVNVHLDILTDRMHWKSLGDGFRVEVSILVNEIPNVLLIPIGSLFSKDGQPAIFVIENDQLKLTPVEIGDRNQEFALLLSQNLQENVKVVLYPGSTLKNGDKIKVRN